MQYQRHISIRNIIFKDLFIIDMSLRKFMCTMRMQVPAETQKASGLQEIELE